MLSGEQGAPGATITVRNLITALNPAKRVKLKENQHSVLVAGGRAPAGEGELARRKLPLGNYASAANILPGGPGGLGEVQFVKGFFGAGSPSSGKAGRKRQAEPKGTGSAVERRNARERNRVQQVNNGFAALRQRIPDEIAEAFEAGTATARGVHKKLSKVETLRMAVEYIKSLERLLAGAGGPCGDGAPDAEEALPRESALLLPATPPPEPAGHPTNFFLAIKPRALGKTAGGGPAAQGVRQVRVAGGAALDQTQITIINGHQYMRIPGTNTFQFLDPERLYDEDLESSAGLDFSEDSATRAQLLLDEEDDDEEEEEEDDHGNEEDEDDTVSSGADLLSSESALALSPQSNFTPDSDGKRDVDSFYLGHPVQTVGCVSQLDSCQPPQQQQQLGLAQEQTSLAGPVGEELGSFDQQQYDDLMLIKSELEDEADLTEDPAFISWIETSQQLQLQQQLHQQLQQQLQQHQSILD